MAWWNPRAWFKTSAVSARAERAAHQSAYRKAWAEAYERIKAKYDAAATTPENRNHWANADGLSPKAANSIDARATLRERARYERDNNCYAKGIVEKLAKDLVRTGPRLQLLTDNQPANRRIEDEFEAWAEEVDLCGKLTTLQRHRVVDGEGFLLFKNNPGLTGPVQLDLVGIECDRVTDYYYVPQNDPTRVDGIVFDKHGNPLEYHVLPYHPGDNGYFHPVVEPDNVPAKQVLHWFRVERFGTLRGISELTPTLPLFGQLRRYTLAVLMAAEIAAELCVFLETQQAPNEGPAPGNPFEFLELVRGMITPLPGGWKANAFRPEQPTTGFGDFVDKILREIAASQEMPFGIAANDFSASNYSSGRLDVQSYHNKIKCERNDLQRLLNRIFAAWLDEAMLAIPDLPLAGLPPFRTWRKKWFWDGFPHVDPLKEAVAIETLLRVSATTLDDVWAEKGEDVYDKVQKIAALKKEFDKLGLAFPGTTPASAAPNAAQTAQQEEAANAPAA